nr:CoA-disulfide reductase [uncultured Acetatifactor sp.]
MKVIIVGGVAGGATAAARIRRLDENAQITVFERSGHVSYANCGLPYYIGDVITDSAELTLQTPESFLKRFRINMKVHHEVTDIHSQNKTVTVRNLVTGEIFTESYDKLLLSPGAKPTKPPFPGIESDKLFSLRTVEDTLQIKEFVQKNQPASVVLAGGGFIGLELAENLRSLGLEVTIVQGLDRLLTPLDYDMASFIHAQVRQKGIRLLLNSFVEGFEEHEGRIRVLVNGHEPLNADMAVLAIGVTPDTQLAKSAGLELGVRGSIAVNDRMETSIPDIYAVGDAVEIRHFITNRKSLISLAGPANKQGRIAADNICGMNSQYRGSLGTSVIKIFDLTAASAGINEETAREAGLDYDKVFLSPANHASYYPGGRIMTMKIIFEKNSYKLLGAQIVGYEGTDKRIDVLATAMYSGLTALDLKDLDLAYAPPFSSAKDPVNMAGFMIENIASEKVKQFHWNQVKDLPRDGSLNLLDVRTVQENASGAIEGFVNIPVDELRERMNELEKEKPVYITCQSGLRSYLACRILSQNGFECYNLSGGYRLYASVEKEILAAESALPCGADK